MPGARLMHLLLASLASFGSLAGYLQARQPQLHHRPGTVVIGTANSLATLLG